MVQELFNFLMLWLHNRITILLLKTKNKNVIHRFFHLFIIVFLVIINLNGGQFSLLTNINIIKKINVLIMCSLGDVCESSGGFEFLYLI